MLATPMTPQASHHSSSSSNMVCSLASTATTTTTSSSTTSSSSSSSTTQQTMITSRPKLTLQTTSLPRTFGTSSTGLSLSLAAGTASPTVRNTFKNAYEVTGPASATASPSSKHPSQRFSKPSSPYTTHNPYQLPLGVKSILRNSPLEPTCRRRAGSVATTGPNGGPSARRVFFPAKKQVSYRNPLEEEIQTVHYTARHSDLHDDPEPALEPQPQHQQPEVASSDEDSDSNASGCPSDTSTSEDEPETGLGKTTSSPVKRKKRKHANAERQVRAVALMDGIAGPSNPDSLTPQTPRRKRAKRRCEWRWTLGPLENRDTLLHPVQDETGSTSSASQPETIPHESETETPSSDPPLSSASTTLYHSSPSSSVSSDVETESDEWRTHTIHELECAHADQ
ncbi:hypothetical protein AbraIFM66951_004512 [Aspergillus brasiliensis]|uniref:Uncharacterized protein n=1 Tax=Aspergillus brasiliensis TaxID=319629 RepID=A0A9W5YMG0_9EURO|nr:hypothetical protein AbraCBS73388_003314 [Aspergillus brasiliensis]GKZ43409.1 hypothetical protein AbraIFM66951_004512 [Aspergillus brasiliensis]